VQSRRSFQLLRSGAVRKKKGKKKERKIKKEDESQIPSIREKGSRGLEERGEMQGRRMQVPILYELHCSRERSLSSQKTLFTLRDTIKNKRQNPLRSERIEIDRFLDRSTPAFLERRV